ncbi:MAG: hypothetical protein LBB81_03295 [Treponema sp.]|nr:hypothetical protein [Treponema sp.]
MYSYTFNKGSIEITAKYKGVTAVTGKGFYTTNDSIITGIPTHLNSAASGKNSSGVSTFHSIMGSWGFIDRDDYYSPGDNWEIPAKARTKDEIIAAFSNYMVIDDYEKAYITEFFEPYILTYSISGNRLTVSGNTHWFNGKETLTKQ